MSNPTLDEALVQRNVRSHEIEQVITHFFLRLTSRMNCSAPEIADGLVGSLATFLTVAAMPNERAEVVDRVCRELRFRTSGKGR